MNKVKIISAAGDADGLMDLWWWCGYPVSKHRTKTISENGIDFNEFEWIHSGPFFGTGCCFV